MMILPPLREEDCFIKLKFKESQLQALNQIYTKYFLPKIDQRYNGRAFVFLWDEDATWETGKGLDKHHSNPGYSASDCRQDPLWGEFADLLPYMNPSASVTKMPAGDVMRPHVDRQWRPNAIYFPISGCTEACVSEYYNLPITASTNSQAFPSSLWPMATHTYSVVDAPMLTNVHLWHGVKNKSSFERTAFGWNMAKAKWTFAECKQILVDLGYADV